MSQQIREMSTQLQHQMQTQFQTFQIYLVHSCNISHLP